MDFDKYCQQKAREAHEELRQNPGATIESILMEFERENVYKAIKDLDYKGLQQIFSKLRLYSDPALAEKLFLDDDIFLTAFMLTNDNINNTFFSTNANGINTFLEMISVMRGKRLGTIIMNILLKSVKDNLRVSLYTMAHIYVNFGPSSNEITELKQGLCSNYFEFFYNSKELYFYDFFRFFCRDEDDLFDSAFVQASYKRIIDEEEVSDDRIDIFKIILIEAKQNVVQAFFNQKVQTKEFLEKFGVKHIINLLENDEFQTNHGREIISFVLRYLLNYEETYTELITHIEIFQDIQELLTFFQKLQEFEDSEELLKRNKKSIKQTLKVLCYRLLKGKNDSSLLNYIKKLEDGVYNYEIVMRKFAVINQFINSNVFFENMSYAEKLSFLPDTLLIDNSNARQMESLYMMLLKKGDVVETVAICILMYSFLIQPGQTFRFGSLERVFIQNYNQEMSLLGKFRSHLNLLFQETEGYFRDRKPNLYKIGKTKRQFLNNTDKWPPLNHLSMKLFAEEMDKVQRVQSSEFADLSTIFKDYSNQFLNVWKFPALLNIVHAHDYNSEDKSEAYAKASFDGELFGNNGEMADKTEYGKMARKFVIDTLIETDLNDNYEGKNLSMLFMSCAFANDTESVKLILDEISSNSYIQDAISFLLNAKPIVADMMFLYKNMEIIKQYYNVGDNWTTFLFGTVTTSLNFLQLRHVIPSEEDYNYLVEKAKVDFQQNPDVVSFFSNFFKFNDILHRRYMYNVQKEALDFAFKFIIDIEKQLIDANLNKTLFQIGNDDVKEAFTLLLEFYIENLDAKEGCKKLGDFYLYAYTMVDESLYDKHLVSCGIEAFNSLIPEEKTDASIKRLCLFYLHNVQRTAMYFRGMGVINRNNVSRVARKLSNIERYFPKVGNLNEKYWKSILTQQMNAIDDYVMRRDEAVALASSEADKITEFNKNSYTFVELLWLRGGTLYREKLKEEFEELYGSSVKRLRMEHILYVEAILKANKR